MYGVVPGGERALARRNAALGGEEEVQALARDREDQKSQKHRERGRIYHVRRHRPCSIRFAGRTTPSSSSIREFSPRGRSTSIAATPPRWPRPSGTWWCAGRPPSASPPPWGSRSA